MNSQFASPQPSGIEADPVLRYLIEVQLVDFEAEFRGILENVAEEPGQPMIRDITIATIAILMTMGGVKWPVVMRVLTHLSRRSDEELQQDAVAILNGSHMVLPEGKDSVAIFDLATLRQVPQLGPAFVSTVYSCTAVWNQAAKIMG